MRYNKLEFEKAVNYYKQKLKGHKSIYLYGSISRKSFFSIAPLSFALSHLGIDLNVSFGHKVKSYEYLFEVWKIYEELIKNKNTKRAGLLKKLISEVKIKGFSKYFEKPDLLIQAKASCFNGLKYNPDWFTAFQPQKLNKTSKAIIKNVYALKKSEYFGMGFVLLSKQLHHPLQDYLDSYAIGYSIFNSAKYCKGITLKASTLRKSTRSKPEKISELLTTLVGFELDKKIDLPVFKAYNALSKEMTQKPKIPQASFFISSKGYHGKHMFGEKFGYPTLNKKTNWNSPGGMIYKFHWYPQSVHEDRPPKSRLSFTSTVPLERFVESTLIDYNLMRKRNKQIGDLLEGCQKVIIKSKIENGSHFEVGLMRGKKQRLILYSDSDTRFVVNPRIKRETGKEMGMMANIPGGEAFTTPVYVKGKIVGDVVINIDKSYTLNPKNPFIAESTKSGYKIISGPKKVIDAFNKRKKEAWKNIIEQEKNQSLDKNIINLKKKNFNKIGEFAINTNPNAKLCDYLIINEKIANMIHVAFGSGFEPDAATEYHMDVVIDAPRQKLDIYGVSKSGRKNWIIKNGTFCI